MSQSPTKSISTTIIECSMLPLIKYQCCEPFFGQFTMDDYKAMFRRLADAPDRSYHMLIKLMIDCCVHNSIPLIDVINIPDVSAILYRIFQSYFTTGDIHQSSYTKTHTCATCEKRVVAPRIIFSFNAVKLASFMSMYSCYAEDGIGVINPVVGDGLSSRDFIYCSKHDALARFPNANHDIWLLNKVYDKHNISRYDTGLSIYTTHVLNAHIIICPYEHTTNDGYVIICEVPKDDHKLIVCLMRTRSSAKALTLPYKVGRFYFKKHSLIFSVPFKRSVPETPCVSTDNRQL